MIGIAGIGIPLASVALSRRRFDMSRYFFHLRRGQVTVLDQEGVELASIEDAAREATRRAQEIASKDALHGGVASSRVISIADDAWRTVMELTF
jgi:uncharacterized protein DUF6894